MAVRVDVQSWKLLPVILSVNVLPRSTSVGSIMYAVPVEGAGMVKVATATDAGMDWPSGLMILMS